jgi:hypothetical protein
MAFNRQPIGTSAVKKKNTAIDWIERCRYRSIDNQAICCEASKFHLPPSGGSHNKPQHCAQGTVSLASNEQHRASACVHGHSRVQTRTMGVGRNQSLLSYCRDFQSYKSRDVNTILEKSKFITQK